ncbi:hypothetical protein, partial [Burkholderia ambifaria]|uniref:hypothetical protein n=1 Tax=Burkholderia ambifaria TaxID=152480 RepID=UPI001E5D6EFB
WRGGKMAMDPDQCTGLFVSISDQTCDPCRRSRHQGCIYTRTAAPAVRSRSTVDIHTLLRYRFSPK